MEIRTESPLRTQKVVIVDKYPIVREGLIARFALEPDLSVCGVADDIPSALRIVTETSPGVVVVDVCLKNGDGLDLIKRLKLRGCDAKFLVWSVHDDSLYAERAVRAGASGYINKEKPVEAIVEAIRRVYSGSLYLKADMMDSLVRRTVAGARREPSPEAIDELSDRELEVFRMTGEGLDTYAIAVQMKISPKTVETYKARIKDKLGLDNGSAVLVRAVRWVVENESNMVNA
jgi:DNA-binding NarL/FixJ family response regulator